MLIFAHPGVGFGVVEIGVGIEHAQHARNGAVVDGAVGPVAFDGFGVVLFHQRVDIGKRLEAVAELAFVCGGLGSDLTLQDAASDGADGQKESNREKSATRAGSHKQWNLRQQLQPSRRLPDSDPG